MEGSESDHNKQRKVPATAQADRVLELTYSADLCKEHTLTPLPYLERYPDRLYNSGTLKLARPLAPCSSSAPSLRLTCASSLVWHFNRWSIPAQSVRELPPQGVATDSGCFLRFIGSRPLRRASRIMVSILPRSRSLVTPSAFRRRCVCARAAAVNSSCSLMPCSRQHSAVKDAGRQRVELAEAAHVRRNRASRSRQ